MVTIIPVPEFFDPSKVKDPFYHRVVAWPSADLGNLNLFDFAREYRRRYKVKKVRKTDPKIILLWVDPQGDFCFIDGSLAVAGALDDILRVAQWAYHHVGYITRIVASSDAHRQSMVSHPHFLVDSSGNHPKPIETAFTAEDFRSGRWRVNPDIVPFLPGGFEVPFINEFLAFYCDELEKLGRPQLRTWPEHCLAGAFGQQLVGVVDELMRFHEYLRGAVNVVLNKGESPFLECFSAVGPDLLNFQDGTPIPGAVINKELLQIVGDADALIVAGEASTHCVPATIRDLLLRLPHLRTRTYLLEDGMSPVTGLEFLADEAKGTLMGMGVHYVRTTDSIDTWPGILPELVAKIDRES